MWSDGRKYVGEWVNGTYHGRGVYTHRDKSTYDGEWKDNLRHGKGIFRWADGDEYEGQWVSGRRVGPGILRYKDQDGQIRVIEQVWDELKFDKHNKGIPTETSYRKRKAESDPNHESNESKKLKKE